MLHCVDVEPDATLVTQLLSGVNLDMTSEYRRILNLMDNWIKHVPTLGFVFLLGAAPTTTSTGNVAKSDAAGLFELGVTLDNGDVKNAAEVVSFYRRAAQMGFAHAMVS